MTSDWISPALLEYCNGLSAEEPPVARRIREAAKFHPRGYWCLDKSVGTLLRTLVRIAQPQRLLEIGTFLGYATAMMDSEMGDRGVIETFERDDDTYRLASVNLAPLIQQGRVFLSKGDGYSAIKNRGPEAFDFILLDADKSKVADAADEIRQSLKVGGLLVVDNALLRGASLQPKRLWEIQTHTLNEYLATTPFFLTALLPIRDGLNLAVRVR